MPKSKRNKRVDLTKTTKQGQELKKRLFEEIRSCIENYTHVFVFSVNDMRNSKMKNVRQHWKDSRFFIGKNKVMALALGTTPSEEFRLNLHKVAECLRGQRGLFFSNRSKDEIINWFESYSEGDYARSGNSATQNVYLKKGPMPQFAHSLEPYLRTLGLPTKLQKGIIHLIKDYEVCKVGDRLSPEAARILKLLGYEMAEFHVKLECAWSQDGSFINFNNETNDKVDVESDIEMVDQSSDNEIIKKDDNYGNEVHNFVNEKAMNKIQDSANEINENEMNEIEDSVNEIKENETKEIEGPINEIYEKETNEIEGPINEIYEKETNEIEDSVNEINEVDEMHDSLSEVDEMHDSANEMNEKEVYEMHDSANEMNEKVEEMHDSANEINEKEVNEMCDPINEINEKEVNEICDPINEINEKEVNEMCDPINEVNVNEISEINENEVKEKEVNKMYDPVNEMNEKKINENEVNEMHDSVKEINEKDLNELHDPVNEMNVKKVNENEVNEMHDSVNEKEVNKMHDPVNEINEKEENLLSKLNHFVNEITSKIESNNKINIKGNSDNEIGPQLETISDESINDNSNKEHDEESDKNNETQANSNIDEISDVSDSNSVDKLAFHITDNSNEIDNVTNSNSLSQSSKETDLSGEKAMKTSHKITTDQIGQKKLKNKSPIFRALRNRTVKYALK